MSTNPKIFNRSHQGHPLEKSLIDLEKSSNASRYVAINWRYDHRVSDVREHRFLAEISPNVPDAQSLKSEFKDYCSRCMWQSSTPDYDNVRYNGNNFTPPLPKMQKLIRIISLNHHCFDAATKEMPERMALPSTSYADWLDEQLEKHISLPDALRAFINILFSAWNQWSQTAQHRPFWACFSRDLKRYLGKKPWADRLRDAIGLADVLGGEWLIALEYSVAEVGQLVRPTSLEADWYWAHFPSPPSSTTGYTMNLNISDNYECLLPEVIHYPLRLSIAHWKGLIDKTQRQSYPEPWRCRVKHHNRLKHEFGSNAILAWMPSPI